MRGNDPRREGGAALVEFAILVPLLVMLLFGIVSAGIAFNHSLALTHAAREAARQAATLPVTNFSGNPTCTTSATPECSLDFWLVDVVDQAVVDAGGSLDNAVPGRTVCAAYVHPDGSLPATDVTRSLTRDATGADSYANAACFSDGRPNDERRVQVTVARSHDFSVILFSTPITLDSEAVSRYEPGLGY